MQVIEPFQLVKFKSSVLAQQCEKIGEQILNYQKYIDPFGRVVSNRGGWQSRFRTLPFPDVWGEYLRILSWECYKQYVDKFYGYRADTTDQRAVEQSYNMDFWFNINWPGDYNKEHDHLPDSSGDIDEFFYVPPEMKNDRDFWLPLASATFYVTDTHNTFFVSKVSKGPVEDGERKYIDCNAGDFIIMHPNINHGISINKQESPRISIAYNIEPIVPEHPAQVRGTTHKEKE